MKYLRKIVARICATFYFKYRCSIDGTVSTSSRVRVQMFYTLIANGYIFVCRTVINFGCE